MQWWVLYGVVASRWVCQIEQFVVPILSLWSRCNTMLMHSKLRQKFTSEFTTLERNFYLKNKIRGKENLDTLFHSIWWKRGGCRILSPREKGCWIPRRSQSKVYECTGGPESSSTTVNTCSARTILVHGARTNSSQSKVYVYTAGWPGK